MAKRKRSARPKKSGWYKPETYGVKYGSTTFLLFVAFVAVVAMLLIAKMTGIRLY